MWCSGLVQRWSGRAAGKNAKLYTVHSKRCKGWCCHFGPVHVRQLLCVLRCMFCIAAWEQAVAAGATCGILSTVSSNHLRLEFNLQPSTQFSLLKGPYLPHAQQTGKRAFITRTGFGGTS